MAKHEDHVREENFISGLWNIIVRKSHILPSRCNTPSECNSKEEDVLSKCLCKFCQYNKELDLPQLPEMSFASNALIIEHSDGFGIAFNALDALRLVDNKNDLMKVAIAEAWQEARMENSRIKEVIKPFDWTYTTEYKGTLLGEDVKLKLSETAERIDIEKLKVKEKILFYEDIILFEDELADNGTAQCSVKIRVMPESFFVLLRYFLRVDGLLVRIIDTRLYHEHDKKYLLREQMQKEGKIGGLNLSSSLLRNPQDLWNHLPTVKASYQKMEIPL